MGHISDKQNDSPCPADLALYEQDGGQSAISELCSLLESSSAGGKTFQES